jgi:hypothetical protein
VTTTSDRRKRDENREHHDETPAFTEAEIQARLIDAWDEGFDTGYEDQRYRDTTKPMPLNPYRAEGGGS